MASCSTGIAPADSGLVSQFFRMKIKGINGGLVSTRRSQRLRVWATSSAPRRTRTSGNNVEMVDPLEAKRLAALQMQEIQAKKRFKKQRQIEAINGAWAMIGLIAGLVIEAQTGDSIPAQLAGYYSAVVNYFLATMHNL
ncbi:uncharacterized protein LOC144712736 [Wolffia australiana]